MARGKAEVRVSCGHGPLPLTRGSNQIGYLCLWRLLQMPMSVAANRDMPASMVHGTGWEKLSFFFFFFFFFFTQLIR